jgi:hypothetical protein
LQAERKRECLAPQQREAPRAVAGRTVRANRLALIRAFCASARPSTRLRRCPVHNFFSQGESGSARIVEHTKSRAGNVSWALDDCDVAARDVTETCISSALLHHTEFLARNNVDAKFSVGECCRQSQRTCSADAETGTDTQNLAESLLFFFCCSNPMVVQVDSRPHCIDVCIHSS